MQIELVMLPSEMYRRNVVRGVLDLVGMAMAEYLTSFRAKSFMIASHKDTIVLFLLPYLKYIGSNLIPNHDMQITLHRCLRLKYNQESRFCDLVFMHDLVLIINISGTHQSVAILLG